MNSDYPEKISQSLSGDHHESDDQHSSMMQVLENGIEQTGNELERFQAGGHVGVYVKDL